MCVERSVLISFLEPPKFILIEHLQELEILQIRRMHHNIPHPGVFWQKSSAGVALRRVSFALLVRLCVVVAASHLSEDR